MKKLAALLLAAALPLSAACTAADFDDDDHSAEVDELTRHEAQATVSSNATRKCYCAGAAACTSSRSSAYVFPKALSAMQAAGVSADMLTQTFGDASASVGTHCPEPGVKYSAATDLAQGANPCDRVHKLRARGFAAWYRTAPEFPGNNHIHAVWAGEPNIKASLKRQIDSFLQGRNGLASNGIDNHCPITAADLAGVKSPSPSPTPTPPTPSACFATGLYCGGNKLAGDPAKLYRCNTDGTGTEVEACAAGCSINPGTNDSCN